MLGSLNVGYHDIELLIRSYHIKPAVKRLPVVNSVSLKAIGGCGTLLWV